MPQIDSTNNKRMAKNTLLMYFRMFVLIIVQLYTVPVVLHALGVEDYGIYNVVGGFVLMFTFINGSLISGCQRFMAYAIGKDDINHLKDVFDTSFFIFVWLGIASFVIIEFLGVWFLNNKMTIPTDRLFAANVVLQFSLFSLFVSILSTPFNAAVIAHERMSVYAYTSIFESVYKLAIAILLTVFMTDKLIIYSALVFTSSIFLALFYIVYCRSHFIETRYLSRRNNKELILNIGSYAGWNVIGSVALILRNHGLNIILNLFFNPVMNAAHTIASHLSGLFNQFVNNVYMATRPQMVKQYAAGNINEMWNITFKSSKYAFFLMVYAAVPVVIELPMFLQLWLKDVPNYTVVFSRLIIISILLETIANQIVGAFQAANKIKYYQSVSSVILLSIIPMAYLSLKIYSNPIIPYFIYVIVSLAYAISLIIVSHKQLGLNIQAFYRDVVQKDLIVLIPAFIVSYYTSNLFAATYWRILFTTGFSIVVVTTLIWMIGIDRSERKNVKILINKIRKK